MDGIIRFHVPTGVSRMSGGARALQSAQYYMFEKDVHAVLQI